MHELQLISSDNADSDLLIYQSGYSLDQPENPRDVLKLFKRSRILRLPSCVVERRDAMWPSVKEYLAEMAAQEGGGSDSRTSISRRAHVTAMTALLL